MAKMESVHGEGLSIERIKGAHELDLNDLKCDICKQILWQPVACKNCEIPFCSTCINQWATNNSESCRNNCQEFIQRPCPRFIIQQLARLHFKCANSSHGCDQVLLYENIEAHEQECGFKPLQCQGCHETVLNKDYINHENACAQIVLTCLECNMTYKRGDAASVHTELLCVKEQLRQLRQEFETNRQHTSQQIEELTEKLQRLPEDIQKLQKASEANKQQVNNEIQQLQQSIEVYKHQTTEQIQKLQQNFQTHQEKSDNIVDQLAKRLERK